MTVIQGLKNDYTKLSNDELAIHYQVLIAHMADRIQEAITRQYVERRKRGMRGYRWTGV